MRAAEDIALLDQLSNGKLKLVWAEVFMEEALNMNADADMKDQAKTSDYLRKLLLSLKSLD